MGRYFYAMRFLLRRIVYIVCRTVFLYRRESLGVEKYFTLSRIGRLKIFRLAKNQFCHFAVYLSKKKRANKRTPAIIKILLLINILERYANFIA